MAVRGGKREGAGRPKGSVSAARRDLAAMAKDHAETALAVLAEIATAGTSESARVSAATAILDRAYGKPIQGTVEIPLDKAPQLFDGWELERAKPNASNGN